jgi:hypothetical protein
VRVGLYWSLWEFESPDTGAAMIEPGLLAHLDLLRARWGSPLRFSSTYRSDAHNTEVGGLPFSRHKTGRAVDEPIVDVDPSDPERGSAAAIRARGWIPRVELEAFLRLARSIWPRPEDVVVEGHWVHLEVT